MVTQRQDLLGRWHATINEFMRIDSTVYQDARFMYEAKDASGEVGRLQGLFKAEREGTLPKTHQQCSRSEAVQLEKNELGCCLGVRCKECPYLTAIDSMSGSDEERDYVKAWTCATHILMRGGDKAKEGYVLTDEDVLYWKTLYASMAAADEGKAEQGD